jgi:hypothetical protein
MEIRFYKWFVIHLMNLLKIDFLLDNTKRQDETSSFNGHEIHLSPMQIRSFIIKLVKN